MLNLPGELKTLELAYNLLGPIREMMPALKLDKSRITVEEVNKLKAWVVKLEHLLEVMERSARTINEIAILQELIDLTNKCHDIKTMHITETNKEQVFRVIESYFQRLDNANIKLREKVTLCRQSLAA